MPAPWLGAAIGAGAGLLGKAANIGSANRQYHRQKKLLGIQLGNQKVLNQQGADLQYDLWNKTNYGAQVEHLKEAGLNPALLYGQGGAGGATTGSQGGGNAASGQAQQEAPLDIGAAAQAAATAAQIELTKAQTSKVKEEAKSEATANEVREFAGTDADKTEAQNRKQKAISEGQILFEGKTEATNMFERLSLKEKEGFMEEMVGKQIENELKRANIELTKERVNQIWHEVRQRWAEVGVKGLGTVINSIIAKGAIKGIKGKTRGKVDRHGKDSPLSSKAKRSLDEK